MRWLDLSSLLQVRGQIDINPRQIEEPKFGFEVLKSLKIFVSGRVQGVFFRSYTKRFSERLNDVTGYVKNLHDGRVEIYAEGSEASLRALAEWAKIEGSPASKIQGTEEIWEDLPTRKFGDFRITF
ncbi:MAG: acylphosphatase [Candidatus Heimdallarchaeota archaeon]